MLFLSSNSEINIFSNPQGYRIIPTINCISRLISSFYLINFYILNFIPFIFGNFFFSYFINFLLTIITQPTSYYSHLTQTPTKIISLTNKLVFLKLKKIKFLLYSLEIWQEQAHQYSFYKKIGIFIIISN